MSCIAPPRRCFAAQERGERQTIALGRHRSTDGITDGGEHIDVLGELIDHRTVSLRLLRITNDSEDVVALLEIAHLLNQPVIAKLFAVVGCHDDQRVVPHTALAKLGPQTTELMIDLADHAVVLGPQCAHLGFVSRSRRSAELHREIVQRVTRLGRLDGHGHIGWVVHRCEVAGRRVWRMWAQVAEVREPWLALVTDPFDGVVGEERRNAVLGRTLGLASQLWVRRAEIGVAKITQPLQPRLVIVGKVKHCVEARQHAGVVLQPGIIRTGDFARVNALIGVTKQCWLVSVATRRTGHVVEPRVERCAVSDHAVVHLIHAGVQAGPTRAARRRLAVVPIETHTIASQFVEMGGADQRVASRRQTVATKLVEGNQQHIH